MDTLGRKIQIYRGLETALPTLADGELGYTYDENGANKKLWVGSSDGVNQRIQAEQYIIDDLISNDANASLSARQGKILKEMIDAVGSGGGGDVVDNLLSNSPIAALSARQGKVLNEKIINHENNKNTQKHIELVNTEPVDLTNTGIVLLRRDESAVDAPNQPTFQEHINKIASTTDLGHIKVDGTTIKVNSMTGVASVDGVKAKIFGGDLNSLVESGIYDIQPNSVNAILNVRHLVEVISSDSQVVQIAYQSSTNSISASIWKRQSIFSAGIWNWSESWSKISVELNNTLTSSSTTEAATANAVKQVNDKKADRIQMDNLVATLSNGWTGTLRYYKDDIGRVHIQGQVNGASSSNIVMTTLPLAYRPLPVDNVSSVVSVDLGSSRTVGQIVVNTLGQVLYNEINKPNSIAINFSFRN